MAGHGEKYLAVGLNHSILELFKIIVIPKQNSIKKEDNGVNSVLKKINPNLGCFFLLIKLMCSISFLRTLPYSKIIIVVQMNIIIINEYELYNRLPKISNIYIKPGISLVKKSFITDLLVILNISFLHWNHMLKN